MTEHPHGETVVPMPLLQGGTAEDVFSGFASQLDGDSALGTRVEHATTVIVAEIRGWESVWDRLGADRAGTMLKGTVDRILDALERFGADEAAVSGRSTHPVVTASFVETDHAMRAIAAAGALAEAARTAHSAKDERFHTCVGVNTGVVVTAHVKGSGIDYSSSGTTRMFAVRLQEFAGPGQVFISEATYHAVPVTLDVVPIGPVRTNGDGETQEAYLLRGLAPPKDARR